MIHALLPAMVAALGFFQPAKPPPPFSDPALQRLCAEPGADYAKARTELDTNFDRAIARVQRAPQSGPGANPGIAALVDAAGSVRLADLAEKHAKDKRPATLAYLRDHPTLALTLAFLLKEKDNGAGACALLDRLREKNGPTLDANAPLAAALCVVHDRPFSRRVNENTAKSIDPLDIYAFYTRHAKELIYAPGDLPAELLIYVVDTTATADEMEWALGKYKRSTTLGDRYKEVPYDYASFLTGSVKKSTAVGWNLKTILTSGGVCADQAYFAATVGKAQGVPTAYVTGQSADVGHAWLGFLKSQGRNTAWNFDSGRYDDYKDVRGVVIDPQTGVQTADGKIAILAEFLTEKRAARWESQALTDAARRLAEIQKKNLPYPPAGDDAPPQKGGAAPSADVAAQLALIEAALKRAPANIAAWEALQDIAATGALTLADKTKWADKLFDLCGKEYPDFAFEVLKPMIASEMTAAAQDRLWNNAFGTFKSRPDLAAEVRFQQASAWKKEGNKSKAWAAYNDVLDKFVNDGPAPVRAASSIRAMLEEEGKSADVVKLYANAWKRCRKPASMAPGFAMQSNWFRLGNAYAQALEKAGKASESEKVRATLGI